MANSLTSNTAPPPVNSLDVIQAFKDDKFNSRTSDTDDERFNPVEEIAEDMNFGPDFEELELSYKLVNMGLALGADLKARFFSLLESIKKLFKFQSRLYHCCEACN
eukprot:NODE_149_length_15530_cov_0.274448.p7 type:complete len:106 gc:universal NODE_149_length_15530_cov_0.274448:9805-10122(+)